jgi:hypothetical protein
VYGFLLLFGGCCFRQNPYWFHLVCGTKKLGSRQQSNRNFDELGAEVNGATGER